MAHCLSKWLHLGGPAPVPVLAELLLSLRSHRMMFKSNRKAVTAQFRKTTPQIFYIARR